MISLLLATVSRAVLPLVLLISLYLLVKGQQSPGGGFIAGVMAAGAFVLQYIAFTAQRVKEFIALDYRLLLALGMLLAAGTGIVSIAWGFPFLTSAPLWILHLPFFGEVEVTSATFFDVGIYLVVLGGILTITTAIGGKE